MNDSTEVDFELLFYDHIAKKEPRALNRFYSAKRRSELEEKRVSFNRSH